MALFTRPIAETTIAVSHDDTMPPELAGPSSSVANRAPRPCVLAVDDQRDSLRLLQLRLLNAGMDCVGFSDPQSALAHLQTHTVDLIILDLMMPQMDGYEVCRLLKQDARLRDIPILFLTANSEVEDKVKALDVGGHDYLTKPVEQAELLARTKAALRVKHLQDQLRQKLALQEQVNKMQQEMLSEHWQKNFGQLAASLAHEINNPLAAAIGSIQLLTLDHTIGPDPMMRLHMIDRSLQRASQKLRSLLLIAHSSGTGPQITLGQMLDDLITIVNYQIVMSKVSLTTDFPTDARRRRASSELARAFLYVVNNAIEAVSGQHDAAIHLNLEDAPSQTILRVIDNGPGIIPENLGKVQQAFFTTKPNPHHGVGLYLATEIVQASQGNIKILSPSSTGRGVEVRIELPVRPS
ncbi:MAG TPA: response regulator [Methylomirabilota bacterium]|nr:response regulator [Methylomirabilota bacterium]